MAHPMSTMCSVMLGVLKQENRPQSESFPLDLLPSFIEDAEESQSFAWDTGSQAGWIGHINGCLNSSKTRLEGVSLLRALVSQCPLPAFQQHCVSWVRLLTQILQSHDPPSIISLACATLRRIFREASHIPELSRQVANGYISIVISAALELKTQAVAVEAILACVEHFPGPCGTSRTRVENFLVQLMGCHDNPELALSAGRCLGYLPRVGGGGQGGAKHTEAWSHYCQRALASLRGVVNQLYGDSEHENANELSAKPFDLPSVSSQEPVRTYKLAGQFKVLSACLQTMLRTEFPEIVRVPVDRILSLCYRILGLNGRMLSKKATLQWTLLAGSLPKLHIATFELLSSLITSCRSNLVPHGHMINRLFIQALGWTMGGQSECIIQRPHSGLRVAVYDTLDVWLETVGACSAVEVVSEKLLEQILYDAQPQTQITKLKVAAEKPSSSLSSKTTSKSKQKGRAAAVQGPLTSGGQRWQDPLTNSDPCLSALKVLRCLFLSAGTRVKPDFHKEVHDFIIPVLLRIQQATSDLTPAPYARADCRRALYGALLAAVLAPHPRWPSPLQCAVSLLRRGRQDLNLGVVSFCSEASVICQTLIHPRVPCLQKPLTLAELDHKRAPSYNAAAAGADRGLDAAAWPVVRHANGGVDERGGAVMDTGVGPLVVRTEDSNPNPIQVPVDSKQPEQVSSAVGSGVGPAMVSSSSEEDDNDSDEEEEEAEVKPAGDQIKEARDGITGIKVDNPQSLPSSAPQGNQDESETERRAPSSGRASGRGAEDEAASPRATSKRQALELQETGQDAIAEEEGRSGEAESKKRRTEKEEDGNTELEDGITTEADNEGAVPDETDVMLASFVDSLPDDD